MGTGGCCFPLEFSTKLLVFQQNNDISRIVLHGDSVVAS